MVGALKKSSNALKSRFLDMERTSGISASDYVSAFSIDDKALKEFILHLSDHVLLCSQRREDFRLSVHAQGFVRFFLTGEVAFNETGGLRMHIWHSDVPKLRETPFDQQHRHAFLANSAILLSNEVVDSLYQAQIGAEREDNAFRIYKATPQNLSPGPLASLEKICTRSARTGNMIHYPSNLFHLHEKTSLPTVTVFHRYHTENLDPISEVVGPISLSEVQENFQNPSAIAVDQGQLWGLVLSALCAVASMHLAQPLGLINRLQSEMDLRGDKRFIF